MKKHCFFRTAAHFIAAEKEEQITISYTIKLVFFTDAYIFRAGTLTYFQIKINVNKQTGY
ncbi:MAG: hypothetical protein A2017_04175 [Lentisphaerae bacterium GWF2_44_16]|nr:MAG: hypothetical protein A2017_04175 [Lentisphaerae bacterium GWF2_44_16]